MVVGAATSRLRLRSYGSQIEKANDDVGKVDGDSCRLTVQGSRVQSSVTSSEMKQAVGLYSDDEIDKQELKTLLFHAKMQGTGTKTMMNKKCLPMKDNHSEKHAAGMCCACSFNCNLTLVLRKTK
ncbi:hypothetical protein Tco_0730865 [Tanacetum coccineum]